ncbi:MAG: hypothetical protein IJO91_10895 [Oscillospiraceae bacterium]|nr:hypothetical protein [Oscillospiraceae bacterium]
MISEELFSCIGNIDDTLIGGSEKTLRSVKIRRTAAGACSCAAAVMVLLMLPTVLINLIGASSAAPNGGAPPNEWISTTAPGDADGQNAAAPPDDSGKTEEPPDGDAGVSSPDCGIGAVYEINGSLYEVCTDADTLSGYGIEKPAHISMAGEYIGTFPHGFYPDVQVYAIAGRETQDVLLAEIDGRAMYLIGTELR